MTAPSNEAELCDAFADHARSDGWSIYPEVKSWDLVLERDGELVGIEAKLRCNLQVVADVLNHQVRLQDRRVHHVGVLVPVPSAALREVCKELGINVFGRGSPGRNRKHSFRLRREWRVEPNKLLNLPSVALQDSGGKPSPRCMSAWREGALRLCALLDDTGELSGLDFKREKIDQALWIRCGWITKPEKHTTRYIAGKTFSRYVPGPKRADGPDVGYKRELDIIRRQLRNAGVLP